MLLHISSMKNHCVEGVYHLFLVPDLTSILLGEILKKCFSLLVWTFLVRRFKLLSFLGVSMIQVMLYGGLRVSKVLNLDREDNNFLSPPPKFTPPEPAPVTVVSLNVSHDGSLNCRNCYGKGTSYAGEKCHMKREEIRDHL